MRSVWKTLFVFKNKMERDVERHTPSRRPSHLDRRVRGQYLNETYQPVRTMARGGKGSASARGGVVVKTLETLKRHAIKIIGSKRIAAIEGEIAAGFKTYKKILVKRPEVRAFRKSLPKWIAKNARYKAWAMDDDALTKFVMASPFVLLFMLYLFIAFWRWVAGLDAKDARDAVFGTAKRRAAAAKVKVEIPNAGPERIERTKSGKEITMTTEDDEKLRQLRDALNEAAKKDPELLGTPALRAFVDDSCLCRYLRARKWKVDKALKMLVGTLQWRAKMKPDEITWDDVESEAATGKQYRSGRDRRERRVLVMRPDRENTFNHETNIKFLVYMLENILWKPARERQPRGRNADLAPEQIVILINFTRWSRKNAVSMSTSRETLSILQNHYPERLGLAVCFNPPTIFRVFWSMISPFIDPKTYTKIMFVSRGKGPELKAKAKAVMSSVFHAHKTDDDMGGRVPSAWNFEEYSTHMRDYDAKKKAVMATWK